MNLPLKYALVMAFAAGALLMSLLSVGADSPLELAIWFVVVVVFGVCLYFRMFRFGPKRPKE